jgi:hypothetical protein
MTTEQDGRLPSAPSQDLGDPFGTRAHEQSPLDAVSALRVSPAIAITNERLVASVSAELSERDCVPEFETCDTAARVAISAIATWLLAERLLVVPGEATPEMTRATVVCNCVRFSLLQELADSELRDIWRHMARAGAQGTEARRAETGTGSVVDDGPTPEGDAPMTIPSQVKPASGLEASPSVPIAAPWVIDLLMNQERLGEDFERVLFENLWELYAR